jgi:hypothetical protein
MQNASTLELHADYHRQQLLAEAAHERLVAEAAQPRVEWASLGRMANGIAAWIAAIARRGATFRVTASAS